MGYQQKTANTKQIRDQVAVGSDQWSVVGNQVNDDLNSGIACRYGRLQWYGLLFGMGIVGMMVINQVNARLLNRLGSDTLMAAGGAMAAFSGGIISTATWSGWGGLPLLISGCFLFVSSTGLVLAN